MHARLIRIGGMGVLLAVLMYHIVQVLAFAVGKLPLGADAYAYFGAANAILAGVAPTGTALNPFLPEATFVIAPYLYPPLLAVLLVPLALLPFSLGLAIWLVIVALTTLLLIPALRPLLGWRLAIIAVVWFLPTWESLWLGQINAAIALVLALALVAAQRQQDARGGAWLALGVLLKIMPGLALAVLLLQRRWRAAGSGAVVIVAVVVLTLPFVPLQTWWQGFLHAAMQSGTDPLYVSWTALLRTVPGSIGTVGPVVVVVAIVGTTLWRSRSVPPPLALAAACIAPLLVGTVVWHVQAIVAVPALAVIWQWSRRGRMVAAMTWLTLALLPGSLMPLMLTLCWAACCWPGLIADARPRVVRGVAIGQPLTAQHNEG